MQANATSKPSECLVSCGGQIVQPTITYCEKTPAGDQGWVSQLTHIISNHVIPQNHAGFTFDPRLNQCLALGPNTNPETYVVSIAGHELKSPGTPTELDLSRWILERLELLCREGNYIGGWPHHGGLCLDISVLIRGKAAAMTFGWANRQEAIYHPASGRSLKVSMPIDADGSSKRRSTMEK